MAINLLLVVVGAEVGPLQRLELVDLALMSTVQRGRQRCLQLSGRDHRLQISGSLFMVLDHGRRKRLLIGVPPLLRDLAGLDLEHVAGRGLFDEILALRSDAQR